MNFADLKQLSDFLWKIPRPYRADMNVPARIFDYDINCGVRLLKTRFNFQEFEPQIANIAPRIKALIPSGVGRGGMLKLNDKQMDELLRGGMKWMVRRGFGTDADLENVESGGCLESADPELVSSHAKEIGNDQLGTLGSGNHFIEFARVEQIFNEEIAHNYGIGENQIVVLIQTGSLGLGYQLVTDYMQKMHLKMPKSGINIKDPEPACLLLSFETGQQYFAAMSAAANYAWANRQLITHQIRLGFEDVFGTAAGHLEILYDVAYNNIPGIAKKVARLRPIIVIKE